MHTMKIIALVLGAIILTIGSTLVTIASLWGRNGRRHAAMPCED